MKEYIISKDLTLRSALKIMDKVSDKILFVQENNQLVGSLSDGDIRRALLNNMELSILVNQVMNKTPFFITESFNINEVKKILLEQEYQAIPVLNENKVIVEILFWHKVFKKKSKSYKQLDIPVVLMAGGKGTRLAPFTDILPKPLIPIKNKPVIEIIIDEYKKYGIEKVFISVNFKSRMIKAYFEDSEKYKDLNFIEEDKPLGTAGALKYLESTLEKTFFVSNCDIIIKEDYSKIYDFHKNGDFDLTMIGSVQHHTIPYGVCKMGKDGRLLEIEEKPEYDIIVNTGMYILEPSTLKLIPENELFHITQLIDILIKKNPNSVGVYPVSEKSWIDVGQWEEYRKSIKQFNDLGNP